MTRGTLSLIGLLVMATLLGCAASRPHPTLLDWGREALERSVTVHVASWPSEPEVSCYLAETGEPPEVQPWPEGESDVFRRTFTSKREHDDHLNYTRDLAHEVETLRACVQQLMERTKK